MTLYVRQKTGARGDGSRFPHPCRPERWRPGHTLRGRPVLCRTPISVLGHHPYMSRGPPPVRQRKWVATLSEPPRGTPPPRLAHAVSPCCAQRPGRQPRGAGTRPLALRTLGAQRLRRTVLESANRAVVSTSLSALTVGKRKHDSPPHAFKSM